MKCNPFIKSFFQAERTVMTITPQLRNRFCDMPTIIVYHRTPAGTYEKSNAAVELIGMPLTEIRIDHGGRATGYLKIQ